MKSADGRCFRIIFRGVPGIGEKTASKIISAYHSIENAYAHADEIKPKKASENLKTYYEQAQMSKTLAAINTDCGYVLDIQKATADHMYNEASYQWFKRLEFKNILNRFGGDVQVHDDVAGESNNRL